MKSMPILSVCAASIWMAAIGSAAIGQTEMPTAEAQQDELRQEKQAAEMAVLPPLPLLTRDDEPGQEAQQQVKLEYIAADAQVVKGKPYSADTSTETVQTLTDGNRIVHHTVSKFYRDSEGRTRREETFGNVDPEHPSSHEVKVFIDDPVNGTAYVLDPGSKSVEKLQHTIRFTASRNGTDDSTKTMFKVSRDDEETAQRAPGAMTVKIHDEHSSGSTNFDIQAMDDKRNVVNEDLGAKNIEGVDCNGTRKTITIPASEVGNEKPISIVTETWFAPTIGAVVQSTTDDPRYGKTTYQLTNVQTTEPVRTLFDPPADFKVDGRK
jgi:hypothetical protein